MFELACYRIAKYPYNQSDRLLISEACFLHTPPFC
jgi:hypothetical protein